METTIDVNTRQAVDNLAAGGLLGGALRAYRDVIAMGVATTHNVRALEDSRAVVLALTDASIVTLPLAATRKGQEVIVVNVAADGTALISISPQAADAIVGTVGAVSASGVADKDWENTLLTALKGDYTKLVSDGVNTWYITGGVGVWASE